MDMTHHRFKDYFGYSLLWMIEFSLSLLTHREGGGGVFEKLPGVMNEKAQLQDL